MPHLRSASSTLLRMLPVACRAGGAAPGADAHPSTLEGGARPRPARRRHRAYRFSYLGGHQMRPEICELMCSSIYIYPAPLAAGFALPAVRAAAPGQRCGLRRRAAHLAVEERGEEDLAATTEVCADTTTRTAHYESSSSLFTSLFTVRS